MSGDDGITQVAKILGPLDGAEIPGGCDYCDAYQTVKLVERGVWVMTVRHDAGCPFLTNYEALKRVPRG